MSNGHRTIMRGLVVAFAATAVLALGVAACGDDDGASGSADFAAADLERLNFGPDEVPTMEYQADVSGLGAFSAEQREQAKEEGDESGLELVTRLGDLGLEADYVSQFFATSRDSELAFVESVAFLFEDERAAEEAVDVVEKANAENISPAAEIDISDHGEQPFGARGKFDDFLTYSFGWRVGDAIQVITVAPGDQKAGPESTLKLADVLEAKAQ